MDISALTRSDQNGTGDTYTYHYNGNKLDYFESKGTTYGYDSNGNTTFDGLRGMTIGYNILNLPSSISKSSESISYIYNSSREKLAKRMKTGD
jgi:ABC-type phosphate transport system substrate-binding protein